MPLIACTVCEYLFYAKPSHIKRGWGKSCSVKCRDELMKTGILIACHQCGKETYKNQSTIRRSKSNLFFCNKHCQTIWRNKIYTKEKHANWTTGKSSYRSILLRENRPLECTKCATSDSRVLAVHHKDRNRENNNTENLMWLCHNCHYLVHHDAAESIGFISLAVEITP